METGGDVFRGFLWNGQYRYPGVGDDFRGHAAQNIHFAAGFSLGSHNNNHDLVFLGVGKDVVTGIPGLDDEFGFHLVPHLTGEMAHQSFQEGFHLFPGVFLGIFKVDDQSGVKGVDIAERHRINNGIGVGMEEHHFGIQGTGDAESHPGRLHGIAREVDGYQDLPFLFPQGRMVYR